MEDICKRDEAGVELNLKQKRSINIDEVANFHALCMLSPELAKAKLDERLELYKDLDKLLALADEHIANIKQDNEIK